MFDYQFWFPLLGLAITGYSAYLQRQQMKMTVASPTTERRLVWWQSPAVVATFILACLAWGPFIISQFKDEILLKNVETGIDGVRDNATGKVLRAVIYISVDGNEIYRYSPMRVMAVSFHWRQDRDVEDVDDLQKSAVYDIRREPIRFHIQADPKFVAEYNLGAPSNYALILLPQSLTSQSFSTLRQAKAAGAKVINLGSSKIANTQP